MVLLTFAGNQSFVLKSLLPPKASARTFTDDSNKGKLDAMEKKQYKSIIINIWTETQNLMNFF